MFETYLTICPIDRALIDLLDENGLSWYWRCRNDRRLFSLWGNCLGGNRKINRGFGLSRNHAGRLRSGQGGGGLDDRRDLFDRLVLNRSLCRLLVEIGNESFLKHILFRLDLYQAFRGRVEFLIKIEG